MQKLFYPYSESQFNNKILNFFFPIYFQLANEESCSFLEWNVGENENEKKEFAAISNATNFMKEEGRYKFHLSKEKIMTF